MRFVTILGSTGSIGRQALDVIREFPDDLRVAGLSARSNVELLAEQAREFGAKMVQIADQALVPELRERLGANGSAKERACKGRTENPKENFGQDAQGTRELGQDVQATGSFPIGSRRAERNSGASTSANTSNGIEILSGPEGLVRIASCSGADIVLVATVGFAGLAPTLAAIEAGVEIALANKEVLVVGGEIVVEAARRRGVRLLPVDSEHNAIFQCLQAGRASEVRRLILTCSGGPFRASTPAQICAAGPGETLNHPTWFMGRKITVDSATLMNKGFEVIEAHHLFGIPVDRIEVVIHPQSTIHSMVEFVDGSVIAQLGPADMRLPIQHVFLLPERRPSRVAALEWSTLRTLTFEPPDFERFPCLAYAFEAARAGGTAPCVLNAANEIAVAAHLEGRISCGQIPRLIRRVLDAHTPAPAPDLAALRQTDAWARRTADDLLAAEPALQAGAGM